MESESLPRVFLDVFGESEAASLPGSLVKKEVGICVRHRNPYRRSSTEETRELPSTFVNDARMLAKFDFFLTDQITKHFEVWLYALES